MQKPGSLDRFPKGPGYTPWFFKMSVGTKLNSAFNNSYPNSKKKYFYGYISMKGVSAILTINAPK